MLMRLTVQIGEHHRRETDLVPGSNLEGLPDNVIVITIVLPVRLLKLFLSVIISYSSSCLHIY